MSERGPASAWTDGYTRGLLDAHHARDIADAKDSTVRAALWVGMSLFLALGAGFDRWTGWAWVIVMGAWLCLLGWSIHELRTLTKEPPKWTPGSVTR